MDNRLALRWLGELSRVTGSVELAILLIIGLAVVAACLLHAIAFTIARKFLRTDGASAAILIRVRWPTRLAAILILLAIALPAIDFDPRFAEVVRQMLKIGAAIVMGWGVIVAINAAAAWIERNYRIDVADNLGARRLRTQINILRRLALIVVVLLSAGGVLMSFPGVQAYGVSLFASAGAAGLVLGFAARPLLTSLIAGVQIALTQPIRIDDVVIVEGEWGWIEEINTTYVVVKVWDQRRLIVPLSHFIEKPFENWTRDSADIIGAVTWHVDYRVPVEAMRGKLEAIVAARPEWDGKVVNLQVVDAGPATITVRALVSAGSSPKAWDLRCAVREQMIDWLQAEHPDALPRVRASVDLTGSQPAA